MILFKVPITVGIRSFHKWELVHRFSGYKRLVQDFRPNTILTAGRNKMSQQDWLSAVQVGNNNTAPNASQTGLLGYVAGSSAKLAGKGSSGAQSVAPYFGWLQDTYRIDDPALAGENLQEAGWGWDSSGDNLVARVLIEDQDGNPTVVTPLADEFLDVTVQTRYYPPTSDVTGTITLDGIVYHYIIRAAEVTSGVAWASNIGSRIAPYAISNSDWSAYDGLLGTIEQSPSGISAASDNSNPAAKPYSNNSYQQDITMDVGPTAWVLTGGMRSLRFKTTAGWYQLQLGEDPGALGNKLPKTILKQAGFGFRLAWEEEVLP